MLSKKRPLAEPPTEPPEEKLRLSSQDAARLSRRVLGHYAPLLKGNGVDVDGLALQSFAADLLTLSARACLALRVQVERAIVPGKVRTLLPVVHTAAHLHPRLEAEVERLVTSPDFRGGLADLILSRPDRGFQPQGSYVMPVPSVRVDLAAHESCPSCHHTGGTTCAQCAGAQKVRCAGCDGTRHVRCPECHGACVFVTPQGTLSCRRCQGQGKVACAQCKGQGDLVCAPCQGRGSFQCQDCTGLGWQSIILSARFEVQGSFILDPPAGLPPGLTQRVLARLKKAGDRAAHVQAWTFTPDRDAALSVAGTDPYQVMLPYTVSAPLARYVLPVRGGRIKGTAFGWDMGLLDAPLVLEALLRKPLDQVKALADARGSSLSALEGVQRLRLIREAFDLCKLWGSQKAFLRLRKRYPFGIRADRLADLVRHVDSLLMRAARRAQRWTWIKYGGGALLLLALSALAGQWLG